MDDVVDDFMNTTAGHPVVFQAGTIPSWCSPRLLPTVTRGSPSDWLDPFERRDGGPVERGATRRMAGWFIKGGFKDESGVWHPSGHAYNFEYWDPLNEEDQRFSPEDLTALYDASVASSGRSLPI
jgi:hypothetical protein